MAGEHDVADNLAGTLSLAFAIFIPLVGCSGRSASGPQQATNAQTYAAGSNDIRVVDNAGFVDPGGRTRQASSGASPTSIGPREGVAPPHSESPTKSKSENQSEAETSAAPGGPMPAVTDPSEFTDRAARALCDREAYCDRIGAGKAFESADACMVEKRNRVRQVMGSMKCDEVRGDRLSACLTAIRGAACGPPSSPVAPPPACAAPALCS